MSAALLMSPEFMVLQVLNGLQLSMLLFLLSVGLSVVFGMMNFINLAHGTLYMFGAYLGMSAIQAFDRLAAYLDSLGLSGLQSLDSFWFALAIAPVGVALIGAVLYLLLFRHVRAESPMKQVLVTFALIFVGFDTVRMIWGPLEQRIDAPALLSQPVVVLGETYPSYRLFIIGLGLGVMLVLYVGLERTRIGAIVRAGVDNRMMVKALGVNIERILFFVFCLGCYLAGLAGVVAAPTGSLFPGMDMSVLILALIVVVIGGPGNLKGAILGSLIIGMADTFGQVLIPQFASVIIYALMALVLLARPQGLLPVRASG
ncbi:MAG: branched-chain amino acid ABC transporter permease [Gammaproteobacteria bacterium]